MSNLSEENWKEALEHLDTMKEFAKELGFAGTFYVIGCNELKARYDKGERTKKLYNEMLDLH